MAHHPVQLNLKSVECWGIHRFSGEITPIADLIVQNFPLVYLKPMYIHEESDILNVPTVFPFYSNNINMRYETDTQSAYRQHTVWTDPAQAFCYHDSELGYLFFS